MVSAGQYSTRRRTNQVVGGPRLAQRRGSNAARSGPIDEWHLDFLQITRSK